jgi:hypothetical protein
MVRIFRENQRVVLAAIAALALSITAVAPARAIEDDGRGSSLNSLMNMVGMGDKSEAPAIQYRERSPLVLPPGTQLPEPQKPAAQRTAAWPQDQEVVRARKKAEEARVRVDPDQITTAREIKQGVNVDPRAMPASTRGCSMDPFEKATGCSPDTYWSALAVKKETDKPVQAGVEPERQYLTQPPKGYLKATETVKATYEPKRTDDEDPREFYWNKGKEGASQ